MHAAATAAYDPASAGSIPSRWWNLSRVLSPLTLVLALQAGLSLTLVWSNTAFPDEALYLWEGRVEWQHWLHGTPLPVFHDSGSPYLYPPLGALASAVGGLAGARLLSLGFMLVATALTYAMGHRLFGRTAALWGSALAAVSEPILRLAFATYDPLACMLVIASAYLVVRAMDSRRRGELILASAICLGLASLVAVSFVIYVPAVAGILVCTQASRTGWARALIPAAWLTAGTAVLVVIGMTGMHMWSDFIGSTVARKADRLGQGISLVAKSAWSWDGLVICLAAAGIIFGFTQWGWRHSPNWLLVLLLVSDLLVPAYQAHLGTGFSLDKHMSAGVMLASLGAGYAVSRIVGNVPLSKRWALVVAAVLLAFPGVTGIWYARSAFAYWPNISRVLKVLPSSSSEPLLVDGKSDFDISLLQYYLPGDLWEDNVTSLGSVAAGEYGEVVIELNASTLDNSGVPKTALVNAQALKQEVLSSAGDSTLIAEIEDSGRYQIANIIPYSTANPSDSSGVFVVWRRVQGSAKK